VPRIAEAQGPNRGSGPLPEDKKIPFANQCVYFFGIFGTLHDKHSQTSIVLWT
jgi:hypothetical protein